MAEIMLSADQPRKEKNPRQWGKVLAPYLLISPFYVFFLLFKLLPIGFSLVLSLFNWVGAKQGAFIGFANFMALFKDPAFYKALSNTVFIWFGTVPIQILLATLLAALLNSRTTRLKSMFRTVYFLPVVASLVVTGLLFTQLFNQSYGMVNSFLSYFGVEPINWLTDPVYMKVVLCLAIIWRWTGQDMIIMLAGLQSIPDEIYEAAKVDGANDGQIFFSITLPLLRPVILFDAVVSTIGTFNLFAEPYALFPPTGAGVGQGALVTGTYLYNNAFVFSKFGYGAAIAWVLAIIVFGLSLLQLRLNKKDLLD